MNDAPAPISLSLAAPAYDEADQIADVIGDWISYLRKCPGLSEFEIVVCNDGSRDATGEILRGLSEELEELRVIDFSQNQGAAAALSAAIEATRNDWVLLIDSDGQFPVANVERFLAARSGCDARAIVGHRPEKQDGLVARLGSRWSGAICNWIHGSSLRDFNCALKLVEGRLLRSLPLEARGLNYSTELTSRLLEKRVELQEIDIEHLPRGGGKSSLRLARDASHRLLFVLYIAARRFLLSQGVIRVP